MDNKTLCCYRYISSNVSGVIDLQRHALNLFNSASNFEQKRLCDLGSIGNCPEAFTLVDTKILKSIYKFPEV